ncbi:MAG: serine--tRNA ligase [Parcubacteria group bacterium]|nr:serine--tRNA ligase [Parcubacteria group bacterium]
MLDIRFIRENPEIVKEACRNRQVMCDVDRILVLDKQKRQILQEVEQFRSQQNKMGKDQQEQAQGIKRQLKAKEPELERIEQELEKLLWQLPNIPLSGVPVGKDESDNKVLRIWGKIPSFGFKPKDHLELGEASDIIDVKRAAEISGTRFAYLKGQAVLLEFALVRMAMEAAIKEDFIPVVPPVLVKERVMKSMGYIDTAEDVAERYFLKEKGLFLVGTAEQTVGPMHQGEVFEEADLPKRYVAFSSCFREEAGSYGKDTKGIMRLHQFDKVELFSFVKPQDSQKEHQFLLALEEKLWQQLQIPYRVVQLCTADIARPSAATYDIEAWMPGQNRYREVSSASNTTDFQARRLNTRVRSKGDLPAGKAGKPEFVHMLNATGFAIGRTLIAILENYQQKDGSVKIPKVLQKYAGISVIPHGRNTQRAKF